ncbi:MAG: 3-hydroxyacyl-CoA dehydrogenase, partial [Lysobacterales bacterium]
MQANSIKAVITGGASGLGLAVARHLVAGGARV